MLPAPHKGCQSRKRNSSLSSYDALVAFSGGVDSCTTAVLLRQRGMRVACIYMHVPGCGTDESAQAARSAALALDLPFYEADLSSIYRASVLDYYTQEYLAGRTPNPCIRCNPVVKFGALPAAARAMGVTFAYMATGHYARIERDDAGACRLYRGADTSKDQSYFLYRLSQEQLSHTLFPLGAMRKTEVRDLARQLNLLPADRPDSQDFAGASAVQMPPDCAGDIVLTDGRVLGRHTGYWRYTPGQRKGLGVAYTEPLYVVGIDPEANRVVLGTRAEELCGGCLVTDTVWTVQPPGQGAHLQGRVRSAQPLRGMTVLHLEQGTAEVRFDAPVQGVAPGQSLVLYDGDEVLGGGIIARRVPVGR